LEFNGLAIADSRRVRVLHEPGLRPVYYFPRQDVRMDLMTPSAHRTNCPFKGDASYWTLRVGEDVSENLMWSYEQPYDEARAIAGYVAFYQERLDAVREDGQRMAADEAEHLARPANPYAAWLVRSTWHLATPQELVAALAAMLVDSGVALTRLRLIVRTLHPQLFSTGYGWAATDQRVEVRELPYSMLETADYLESPLYPIFEGAGGVRRRLDVAEPLLDFPILETLHGQGATDYVAMPMQFTDGQINVISLVTDRPGGFTTLELGNLYEVLPLLSRLFEVHALRRTAVTLLDTYLGKHSGKKVLDGLIKRGDGEDLHAVIWFCDLRGSTPLAESLSRDSFLATLNRFFECMAGAVLDQGGEVLRFIGDAVLAIFPIGHPSERRVGGCDRTTHSCDRALEAARDAGRRIDAMNAERTARGDLALAYGIGLHLGDVTYGNIGTADRLEFTVVGSAANEAARIESLCKTLDHAVLISEDLARVYPGSLRPVGRHALRGVGAGKDLYTLP
jgi:class 3 adenylate cyclase/uncharacterized protein (DUF427 family)